MKKYKYLVAGGCSFTAAGWTVELCKHLGTIRHDYANAGLSNDVIAPSVVYGVERLLNNGVDVNDILVGVMWSGVDRKSFFKRELTDPNLYNIHNYDSSKENYTFMIKEDYPITETIHPPHWLIRDYSQGCYAVQNFCYDTREAKAWYQSCLYDSFASRLKTLEKMIWIQSYLKEKNVDYFMSTFRNQVLELDQDDQDTADPNAEESSVNPNFVWLNNLLDKDYFLPIRSYQDLLPADEQDRHPEEHDDVKLVADYILPFIEKMY
jgi:hypothetical protein